MIKHLELSDPDSCLNRANDDEPVFTLLGRDAAAPLAIEEWIVKRIRAGKNTVDDAQILEAYVCMERMYAYQRDNCKTCKGTGVEVVTLLETTCKCQHTLWRGYHCPCGAIIGSDAKTIEEIAAARVAVARHRETEYIKYKRLEGRLHDALENGQASTL